MEQNREPRNKPTPLYNGVEASIYNGLKIVYSVNGVGKLDRYMQKNET